MSELSLWKAEEERRVIQWFNDSSSFLFSLELVNYKGIKKKEAGPRIRARVQSSFNKFTSASQGHENTFKRLQHTRKEDNDVVSVFIIFLSITKDFNWKSEELFYS